MKEMTIMFSDIRGFTTISEQFKEDPQGLTKLINQFLTPMTDMIMQRKGTIDKYMGEPKSVYLTKACAPTRTTSWI